MTLPKLSIILPVYNAARNMPRFFASLEKQRVPKGTFEVLIMDGGSTDRTVAICHAHGATVIPNPYKLAEPGVAIGFVKARGELIMVLAEDNIFRDPDAIAKMIDIFRDTRITAAYPKHDTGRGDTIYSRYINTFTDPFTHFVYGDAANARTFHRIYKTFISTPIYDVYDYGSYPVRPIIALAQGLTIRKKRLHARGEFSDDILSIYKLLDGGKWIAYAHSVTLLHYTIRDTKQFMAKQRRAVENALLRADSGITKRRKWFSVSQKWRMYLYFPYAFSIVLPVIVSVAQAIREREAAWLLHAYMVIFSAIVITITAIPLGLRRVFRYE
jgi:glycosyltransferase involved in cell wall biosynthesis